MTEKVELHLQEGFKDDAIVICVDGVEVARKDDVTTKLLLGYAEVIEIDVPEGQVSIDIALPKRNLSRTIKMQIPEERYLGVSVRPDGIEIIKSDQPFGYA